MKKAASATIMTLFIAIMMCNMSQVAADPTKKLLLRTDKSLYVAREPVTIRVTNVGDEAVDLLNYHIPGPCPDWFRILNEAGDEVFPVIHFYDIWTLYPGRTEIWIWDQRDGYGEFVPAGTYTVETISELDPESSTSFRIVRAVGGTSIPVNKLELLAPWIGLASAIVSTIVVTTVFMKKRRRLER